MHRITLFRNAVFGIIPKMHYRFPILYFFLHILAYCEKQKKCDATIKRGLTFFANFLANISLSTYKYNKNGKSQQNKKIIKKCIR